MHPQSSTSHQGASSIIVHIRDIRRYVNDDDDDDDKGFIMRPFQVRPAHQRNGGRKRRISQNHCKPLHSKETSVRP